jgi:hypothetical protein
MNTVRPRSVSRSRITVIDPGDPNAECLDPCQLLESVLKDLKSVDIPLVVKIADETESVYYKLSTFTSKLWPIRDGKVHFGLKRINYRDLRASIHFDVIVQPDGASIE